MVVESATDGLEALQKARDGHCDLVLMDSKRLAAAS